jgi:hypothetical protein
MPDNLIERVHQPSFLTDLALRYPTPEFLADTLSPRKSVPKQSNKYRKFGKDTFYQVDSTWAPGSIPNAVRTEISSDTYFAEERKLRHPLLDSETGNADADLNLRTEYTETTTRAMRIAREARVALQFVTAANYPSGNVITKAGGSSWDDTGVINTVQPITDIEAEIAVISQSAMTSRSGLTVVIPELVMNLAIRHNSAIRDYFKYTTGGVTTAEVLAALLGVREVLIAREQTAGAGPQGAGNDIITGITTTYLWGDNVWVGVRGSENSNDYTFSRSFNWDAVTGGQELEVREYRMADEGQEGNWIEAKEAVDEKIVANFAGGVIVNCLKTPN